MSAENHEETTNVETITPITTRHCVKCSCTKWDKKFGLLKSKCSCGHSKKSHPKVIQHTNSTNESREDSSPPPPKRHITIVYDEPGDYSKVEIAGTFTKWQWVDMERKQGESGTTFIRTLKIPPDTKEHLFHFKVDASEAVGLNYRTKMDPRGMINVLTID
ncbi:hypothetical protein P9112_000477 [Eukaryota sp. TZLM1-RC]